MSSPAAPPVDPRSATDIELWLVQLLRQYTAGYPFPAWQEFDPVTGLATGASAGLVGVAARFAEIVVDRLNRAPDKNFLAFLDLLGGTLQPPQAAQVPLTFTLAAGSTVDADVPVGTQVAAPAPPGRKDPVVFETTRPLTVSAARLTTLLTVDPLQDAYGDWSDRIDAAAPEPFAAFEGDRAFEHILYIADDLLAGAHVAGLAFDLTLADAVPQPPDPRQVLWEAWDGSAWRPPTDVEDGTAGFIRAGRVDFGPTGALQRTRVDGRDGCWLRARLTTPVSRADAARTGFVRATHLPVLASVMMDLDVSRDVSEGLAPDFGFVNGAPLDLSKEFYPFGPQPRRFDAFVLGSQEAFSLDRSTNPATRSAEITLDVVIANPFQADDPTTVRPSSDLTLAWECWNGQVWQGLGQSGPGVSASAGFDDGTGGLCTSGTVRFTLPDSVPALALSGQVDHWLRVRIVKGNYGEPARYQLKNASEPSGGYVLIPETFAAPIVASIAIGYAIQLRRAPQAVLAWNGLESVDASSLAAGAGGGFAPFTLSDDADRPSLYLGFELPPTRTDFPDVSLTIHARLAAPRYGELAVPVAPTSSELAGGAGTFVAHAFTITNDGAQADSFELELLGGRWDAVAPTALAIAGGASAAVQVQVWIPADAVPGDVDAGFLRLRRASVPDEIEAATFTTAVLDLPLEEAPAVTWQYWNGAAWQALAVQDDTEAFVRPGLLEFVPPPDLAPGMRFARTRWWLRARWDKGDYSVPARLARMQLNTTLAAQTLTLANEILGSSNGAKNQALRSTRAPVLAGQVLEVREPEVPSATEQAALAAEEGPGAVTVVADANGQPKSVWVRWHEVTDFHASAARDRHYVIDHLTGDIRFGDSVNGLIPPRGTGNLRLTRYQTGGGEVGNCAAGTITQLKTTVPYVEKAFNADAAAGGAEAETTAHLRERMPQSVRHRDRAVTPEDFDDLALLASTEVARALCVPLRDLEADPLGDTSRPGTVSVVVVPRAADVRPLPDLALLAEVEAFLRARAVAGVRLSVVGPLYVRVDVQVEVALASPEGASAVQRAVRDRLASFLHPLTGGLDGAGWDFGRAPHRSDFFALVESVPGVDHVRFLQLTETEDQPGVRLTGRFLVFSGTHDVSAVFEAD